MVGAVRRVVTGETRDGTGVITQVEEVEPRRPGGEILRHTARGCDQTPTLTLRTESADRDVTLRRGDVLVKNDGVHAWHNPFDEPCVPSQVFCSTARGSGSAEAAEIRRAGQACRVPVGVLHLSGNPVLATRTGSHSACSAARVHPDYPLHAVRQVAEEGALKRCRLCSPS